MRTTTRTDLGADLFPAKWSLRAGLFAIATLFAWPCAADDLTYLVHAPASPSAHPPLLVLLHGAGADENDMIGLWHDLPADFVVISPRAPFRRDGGGYIWYRKTGATPRQDDLDASRKIIDLLVDNATERFHADPAKVFVGGFSQGAVMTYEVALREPGRFRGGAVLSGFLVGSEAAALESSKPDLTHEALFVAHGTSDNVIPFGTTASARATLAKLGVPVAFHAYQGMAHAISPEETKDLDAWLKARLQ